MNPMSFLFALLAAGAGGCIAVQAVANAKLRLHLGSPASASFASICGTFATASGLMLALTAVRPPPAPAAVALRGTEWWAWVGGPLGAVFVLAGTVLVRELGTAAYFALVVAGQLTASLVLDHYGLMGVEATPVTAKRLLGAGLVVLGVVCIKFL
jgi:transporter family-2 protein